MAPPQAPATANTKDDKGNEANDKPAVIKAILDSSGKSGPIGLNEELRVQVASSAALSAPLAGVDAKRYVLFFDGREVKGLPDPIFDREQQSLVFELKRNDSNKDLWTALLGSPWPTDFWRPVKVRLGERPVDGVSVAQETISATADTPAASTLQLKVLPPARLAIAVLLIGALVWLLWWRARVDATLRDNLLPQIEPKFQTYSLGRWQMAFWFSLIFGSFVFLFVLTWDYNTLSSQALTLMGISGGTSLAAVVVDASKDSPADAVNRGLRALGLNSYADVVRVGQEITDRERSLNEAQRELSSLLTNASQSTADQTRIAQLRQEIPGLNSDILGRRGILRTYQDQITPFLTQGWFHDLTSDLNGIAIHRLQVFSWTLVLGAIYLIGVYRDLAMPNFSTELLTLMGISGAAYVGFKYPETNS